jgi:hypothetical protein
MRPGPDAGCRAVEGKKTCSFPPAKYYVEIRYDCFFLRPWQLPIHLLYKSRNSSVNIVNRLLVGRPRSRFSIPARDMRFCSFHKVHTDAGFSHFLFNDYWRLFPPE